MSRNVNNPSRQGKLDNDLRGQLINHPGGAACTSSGCSSDNYSDWVSSHIHNLVLTLHQYLHHYPAVSTACFWGWTWFVLNTNHALIFGDSWNDAVIHIQQPCVFLSVCTLGNRCKLSNVFPLVTFSSQSLVFLAFLSHVAEACCPMEVACISPLQSLWVCRTHFLGWAK